MPWRGKNTSWPIHQGFYNRSASTPNCNRMAYLPSKIPEGEQKYNWLCGDAGNPLGSYLYSICGRYLKQHPEFPDKDTIQKLVNRQKLRESAGDDATCGMCDRMESQFNRIKRTSRNGNVRANLCRFCMYENFIYAFVCGTCYLFFEKVEGYELRQIMKIKFLQKAASVDRDAFHP